MRSRLRAAASAISAERRSPCAPTRSDCACSRSLSAPPRIASSSFCRFSTCCASCSRDFAFSTPATAVTRSFWPCTNSLASIANSGAPRSTMIARLGDQPADAAGVGREDRRGGVVVDRDLAVGRALVAERDLAHRRRASGSPTACRSAGKRRRRRRVAFSGRATALPGPLSSSQTPAISAATATTPPAASHRRFRLRCVVVDVDLGFGGHDSAFPRDVGN